MSTGSKRLPSSGQGAIQIWVPKGVGVEVGMRVAVGDTLGIALCEGVGVSCEVAVYEGLVRVPATAT
jgi:hypothetical protein